MKTILEAIQIIMENIKPGIQVRNRVKSAVSLLLKK